MVTYFYKSNKKISLDPYTREKICNNINEAFKDFYQDLNSNRDETQQILQEIYPVLNESDKINKIPSLYEQYKTYTSALYRACYPSYDAIVDIEGQDLRSNDLAGIYKASIVYDWNNINLMKVLDQCGTDWTIKGEAAAYICWREDVIEVKQKTSDIVPDEYGMPKMVEQEIKIPIQTFRAVDVKHIDPYNLYFDKTQVDNWRHCRKIYRDFIPIQDVLANKNFKLTPKEIKELKQLVFANDENVSNLYNEMITEDTKVITNTVEVLEFEGDYVDPDTYEVYTNMEATVIAGKYLARFEESKKPLSSIIYGAYMRKPDSGRGQSPLVIPSILNQVQNACADLTMTAWKLNTYPTFLAPKGAFPRYQEVIPGKPIEYDAGVFGGQMPQKLDFGSGLRGFEFTDFFQRKMENATGINQYMQGSNDSAVRTASEAAMINSGATMRMASEAHIFAQNFLLPLVKTYAIYKKVYDTVDREIPMGDNKYAQVTAEVREGNYMFIIGGPQSATEREAETNKLFQLLGLPVVQSLAGLINPYKASEFLKWILNRANFKQTNEIFEILDSDGALRQMAQQLGIQDQNYNEFRRDVDRDIQNLTPAIVQQLIARQMPNNGMV